MNKNDAPPISAVIFGRAHGFETNRIMVIVSNYRGRTLSRELAIMNLEQHGKTRAEAESMLGPDSGSIVAGIVSKPDPDVKIDEPEKKKKRRTKRGPGGQQKSTTAVDRIDEKDFRLP